MPVVAKCSHSVHLTNLEPFNLYQYGFCSDFLQPVDVDCCSTVKSVL